MPSNSEFQERIDVLDIIIGILREHEGTLSRLADRFDAIYDDICGFQEKISVLDQSLERLNGLEVKQVVGAVGSKGPLVAVKCKDWTAFKNASQGALLAAFEATHDRFTFSSVSDLFVFVYSNGIPEVMMLMDRDAGKAAISSTEEGEGQTVFSEEPVSEDGDSFFETVVSQKTVRQWLSAELGISEERVIEGRVLR